MEGATRRRLLRALGLAVAALGLACGADRPVAVDDAEFGARLYQQHGCAACHGTDGSGSGALAPTVEGEVRDLTRDELRYGSSVEAIAETIARGPGAMPAFGHLSLEDRRALARFVRSLARPLAALDVTPGAVRATPSGVHATAAYFTLVNRGGDDELLAVVAPGGVRATLHRSNVEGGVTRMAPVEGVPLPAGGTVGLEPGGLHVMLDGLESPLLPGTTLTLELRFRHHAPILVELPVLREVGG
jgi:periplasmic copper chaperone A